MRLVWICQFAICMCCLTGAVLAQESDDNSAVIQGRVLVASGRPADKNIKIALRNSMIALNTFYTDKHGEFRLQNITQGIYYLRAGIDTEMYDPVEIRVEVPRGSEVHVQITLKLKTAETSKDTSGSKVVSASEMGQKAPGAAKKEYDRGVKLGNQNNHAEAIAHFHRALASFPDYVLAWNALGVQYLRLRNFDEAAKCFNSAIGKNPKYFDSQFNLGLVMIEQKNYVAAISEFNKAIDIDSSQPGAHLWLGFALLENGALPDAESELSKALIESNSTLVAAHFYLAQVNVRKDDLPGAARELNTYLKESPNGEYSGDAREMLRKIQLRTPSVSKPEK
jgi:tetratricopeptide (TPR) repeat protein